MTTAVSPAVPSSPSVAPTRSGRRLRLAALVLLSIAAGGAYGLHSMHYEDTDDAQVGGNMSSVSVRTSGAVRGVNVVENQTVAAGDLLLELDPADLQLAVDQAKAAVAEARARLQAEDPSVPIVRTSNDSALSVARSELLAAQASLAAAKKDVEETTATIEQAAANDQTAQSEKDRSQKLLLQGAIRQSDFDLHSNTAIASAARVRALEQTLAASGDRVSERQAQIVVLQSRIQEIQSNSPRQVATRQASISVRQAELDRAAAQLERAERELAYARVVAPVSGIVVKKSVAVGDYVGPGQQLLVIAETSGLWVTANYRETQLARIRPGQSAQVHVDALGEDFRGVVESLGGATGASLSLVPPENASGNYVKVVQRIPVRIALDPGQQGLDRLRVGMSVEPEIGLR